MHPHQTLELALVSMGNPHAVLVVDDIDSAPVLRWGVRQFDPSARRAAVAGHTVVSSVNRGPADLSFGGRPVVLTAGFPALSPMMSLTHGVHGIGDTVAVSVHADPGNVEIDEYLDRLTRALLHPC